MHWQRAKSDLLINFRNYNKVAEDLAAYGTSDSIAGSLCVTFLLP